MPSDAQQQSASCSLEGCLQSQGSNQLVVGRGNPQAGLMVIGEAPGASEDAQAEPFVGRSGRLLDQLMTSVGFDRDNDVYICNAIKLRPPNNRRPTNKELQAARPWLDQQIKLVDPAVIVLAGSTAMETILGVKGGISGLRGQWQQWNGRWVMPLFHPSYLLRNPSPDEGRPVSLTRSDLIEVRRRLNKLRPLSTKPSLDSVGRSMP